MPFTLSENARAVLLPAFDGTALSDSTLRFLDQGGVSILIGESRAEYVARRMNDARRSTETTETFQRITSEARKRSGLLLTAVDQEMGGICRLHDLVPQFPSHADLAATSPEVIEALTKTIASDAAAMGVNVFLSPVLDVVTGANAWLHGRTWSTDPAIIASLSAAYIRGAQRGGVAATGKHFPGFSMTTADPAIDAAALCLTDAADIEAGLLPFRAAIAAGVEMIMVGPAIVAALDDQKAALRSVKVVQKLKRELGFTGIVMADDLDSQATMRGDTVAQVAIDALNAGCDFLLLADIGSQLQDVSVAIISAANAGHISAEALSLSADKVRALAAKYATGTA
ncbi:MAG: glycoside hydrolase family 3 N-terminal domain-containing protein [Pseudomonadota bacterium]